MTTATLFATSRVPKQYEAPLGSEPEQKARRRAIACAAAVVIALTLVACASTTQGKVYQSIATCNATEQGAVRAFGVLYQAHKAENPALWADRYNKAMAAHAAYEKIRDAAVDAAKANGETAVVLSAVNQSLNELIALLATFGVGVK